jgi:hypothetical protein
MATAALEPVPAPPEFVVCGGLRYVTPHLHCHRVALKLKHEAAALPLAQLLAYQFPTAGAATDPARHAAGSPSTLHWSAEIQAGRVEYLRHNHGRGRDAMWQVLEPGHVMDKRTRGGALRITVHAHEHAVGAALPQLLFADHRLVVVNKPAGVPCIAGGRALAPSHANLLDMLPRLWPELVSADRLTPVHRLDKPVSGVWVLARSPALQQRAHKAMEGVGSVKTYLARVEGVFPPDGAGEHIVDLPLRMERVCA